MAQIVLLSDIPTHSRETYAARYAGPYVVRSQLEAAGYDAIVLDWFRFLKNPDDFFTYLENFIDSDTLCVGITTTFLIPQMPSQSIGGGMGQVVIQQEEFPNVTEETVAASSLYLWEWSNDDLAIWFERLRKLLDKYNPNAKIILGGHRVHKIIQFSEIAPKNYCIKLYVDFLLAGYADFSMVTLIDKIKNKKSIIPSKVKNGLNIIIPSNFGTWKSAKEQVPVSLFSKKDAILPRHWLPLEVSRGCAFNCKFCSYEKRGTYKKDMKQLYEELCYNYDNFGTTGYNISSDCFNDDRRFVGEWAELTAKLPFKIEWVSFARLDLFNRYPETMDEMLGSGYRAGWFGIETLCHEAGKAAGKGLHPDKVKELIKTFREKGKDEFWFTAYFIIGLPKETVESLDKTLEWLIEQRLLDEVQVSSLGVAPFIEELSSVIDFSDHSKMPQKFGFNKLTFDPEFYWEHDTMNYNQCRDIQTKWQEAFYDHPFTRFGGGSHGEYPRIRDLGLTHKQTVTYLKTKFLRGKNLIKIDKDKKRKFKQHVIQMSEDNVKEYYENMLRINAKSNSLYTA